MTDREKKEHDVGGGAAPRERRCSDSCWWRRPPPRRRWATEAVHRGQPPRGGRCGRGGEGAEEPSLCSPERPSTPTLPGTRNWTACPGWGPHGRCRSFRTGRRTDRSGRWRTWRACPGIGPASVERLRPFLRLDPRWRTEVHGGPRGRGDRERPPGSRAAGGAFPGVTAPVDINRATAAELQAIPGIGPVIAERIVAYRSENGPVSEGWTNWWSVAGVGDKDPGPDRAAGDGSEVTMNDNAVAGDGNGAAPSGNGGPRRLRPAPHQAASRRCCAWTESLVAAAGGRRLDCGPCAGRLAASLLTQDQRQRFDAAEELDFAFTVEGLARFRGNCFRQRGERGDVR